MQKPRICAVIVDEDIRSIKKIETLVDLFEVRMDLIGGGWQGIVKQLEKPWIACNRSVREGGKAENEEKRLEELLRAVELGADIVDIEFNTDKIADVVARIKERSQCLLSFHDFHKTPDFVALEVLVKRQIKAGADICKVTTTARSFADNLIVLQLIYKFPKQKVVSFAMGDLGLTSRILSPLLGGYFTYASIQKGKESAAGQMTVKELLQLYEMMRK